MDKPLSGKRIVVTRSQEQAGALSDRLAELGAVVIPFPTIQFVPLESDELAAAQQNLSSYDWLLFTSRNAVTFFLNGETLTLPRVAAVGSATANELAQRGIAVQAMPDTFTGAELAASLGDLSGRKILLPRSRLGRPDMVSQLEAQGAHVTDIALYDTIPAQPAPEARQELTQGFDAITFTSPSTVQNFCRIVPDWREILSSVVVACIGPTTAVAAAQQGLTNLVTADEHTAEGIVKALIDVLSR